MRDLGRKLDDHEVLNLAVIASFLTALLVERRHHQLVVGASHDPALASVRRTRFLLELWALSGICLFALVAVQGGPR
jgi:hypothetical protein